MPSKYKRRLGSRKYRDFSAETLEKALQDINRNNLSYREAAEKYDIPRSTLQRKRRRLHTKPHGGQTVLTPEEETLIIRCVLTAADWGFPFEKEDLLCLVKSYVDRSGKTITKFQNNMPGSCWYYAFLGRHREISRRLAENVKRARAKVSWESVNEYFDNLSVTLANVPPENILNYDETGFVDDPGRNKVLVRKMSRHAERILDSAKTNISVMFCISGSAKSLPPYIVYKAEHVWSTWTESGPPGARYNRSKSGWFDQNLFEDWFETIVIPYFRNIDGPKVVIGDNLASHLSVHVLTLCEEHNIRFVLLPPNSTHLIQPLDVACFRPLKGAWRKILKAWKLKNRGSLRKDMFPTLLRRTLDKVGSNHAENIKQGFKATGHIPLNRNVVLDKLPKQDRPEVQGNQLAATASTLSVSLQEMFHSARFGTNKDDDVPKGRKKKLNVPPGQSISLQDIVEKTSSGPSKVRSKIQQKPNEECDETDTSVQSPDSDDDNSSHGSAATDCDRSCDFTKPFDDLSVDDFVVVELQSEKGRCQRFVARITEERPYRCSFLRNGKLKNGFCFPSVLDEADLEENMFIGALPPPLSARRGTYVFGGEVLKKFRL